MSVTRFRVSSPLSPSAAMAVLTDFSPARTEVWSGIDPEHFQVHDRGADWAEVTEGNDAAWERGRYEWDAAAGSVTVVTHDSKLFGAGGGWDFRFIPDGHGTRIEVALTRTPLAFGAKILAALLPIVGAPRLKKSFTSAFSAR
ncbi:conserved exported hypothetical protein [Microbacterium sp. 8M]|uniref:hypothetical protein n=1 Tax=Microbacterium sp. 8M TaxID=2653153 RepID=UPI0012F1B434|nr:hypothetical protein [Microbacterium sp. 8M]VXB49431.1 conserved exported hypothetical protein [Microbacterium sp. 8M]